MTARDNLAGNGRAPARRRWRRLLAALATLAALLILTRASWLAPIGAFLIVADPPARADAVVPLAGDRARVTYAGQLLARNQAQWFAITDMWIDNTSPPQAYAGMIRKQAGREGVPAERIVVAPGTAATTYREGYNLLALAQARGWRSVIVVTNTYHTRRARAMLHEIFRNSGISVIIQPIANDWYQPDSWWRSREGWRVTAEEYAKFGLYLLGYHWLAGS